jgi:hypothetical protein
MDVDSAYLNAYLDEPIYLKQPPGYNKGNDVLLLKKALYGLKQSGRQWHKCLSDALFRIGFTRCNSDPAIFYSRGNEGLAIIATAVDDLTITATNDKLLSKTKDNIKGQFNMKDLGEIYWLLNIKIERDRKAKTINLSQSAYIEKILKRFNLQEAKTVSMPVDPNTKLNKDQCAITEKQKDRMKNVPYRQAVGSLMWAAVATRPDIAFAVSLLSQFMECPGEVHWEAIKRVLKYLKGTKNNKLIIGKTKNGLIGYSDADWASQEHRHSISAYSFIIDGGAISWSCQKQHIIALSTAEAEFVSLTQATKEALWLSNLINEIFQPLKAPIKIFCDNQSAITIANGNQQRTRTKHFDIRLYFIRENIENNKIIVEYIPTEQMIADLLTKPLPAPRTKMLAQNLGIYEA